MTRRDADNQGYDNVTGASSPRSPHGASVAPLVPNEHLALARERKAQKLATQAAAQDVDSGTLALLSDTGWSALEGLAKVPHASEATRTLTIEIRRKDERARATAQELLSELKDPLDGLPRA